MDMRSRLSESNLILGACEQDCQSGHGRVQAQRREKKRRDTHAVLMYIYHPHPTFSHTKKPQGSSSRAT
jgi:hypothetical protein